MLCALAFKVDHPAHDALLQGFLTVDDNAKRWNDNESLLGIRKAQVCSIFFF